MTSIFSNVASLVAVGGTPGAADTGLASGLESWTVGFEAPEVDEDSDSDDDSDEGSVDEDAESGEVPAETIVDDGEGDETEEELDEEEEEVSSDVEALYDATMGLVAYGPGNPMVAALAFKAGLLNSTAASATESYSAFLTEAIESGKPVALADSAMEGVLDAITEKVKNVASRVAGLFSKLADAVINRVKGLFGKAEDAEKKMSQISQGAQAAGEEKEARLPKLGDVMFDLGVVFAGAAAVIGVALAYGADVHKRVGDVIAKYYKQLKTGVTNQWKLINGRTVKTAAGTYKRKGLGFGGYTKASLRQLGYKFRDLWKAIKDICNKLRPSNLKAELKQLTDVGASTKNLNNFINKLTPEQAGQRAAGIVVKGARKTGGALTWIVNKASVVTQAFSGVKHFLLHTFLGKITLAVTACLAAFAIYRRVNKEA